MCLVDRAARAEGAGTTGNCSVSEAAVIAPRNNVSANLYQQDNRY